MFASTFRFFNRLLRLRHVEEPHALWLSKQRFNAIWDAAADAMVISNANGIVLAANPAYYHLYGYSPNQILGQNFAIIFPEDQRETVNVQYTELFQRRTDIPTYESHIRTADGSERIVEARATFITFDTHQPAMLSVIRDITSRKQLEQERDSLLSREHAARIEAEAALRIRDQFLAIAAHELKNPLTSLQGYTEVLSRRTAREQTLNGRDQRTLQVIAAQAKRLHGLIDSLLDIGRIQAGKLSVERQPLNLCELVGGLVEEVQPTLENHAIQFICEEDALIIAGDVRRLEQVLHNLLQNALKYSPAGGLVMIQLYRKNDHAYLLVSDQGIGIPKAAQAHVFQQFYRAENVGIQHIQGMGIGLYVVNEIVALHDGTITVVSQEGEGSTFTVSLPLYVRPL